MLLEASFNVQSFEPHVEIKKIKPAGWFNILTQPQCVKAAHAGLVHIVSSVGIPIGVGFNTTIFSVVNIYEI